MENCSDIDGLYTVTATAGVVAYLPSIGRYVITELPLGTFQLKVRSLDCCGNATEVEVDITVEDLVPPYVTCEVYRTTSLTIDGTSRFGLPLLMMVLMMLVVLFTSKLSVWKTCWELITDLTLTNLLRSVTESTEMIT